MSQENNRSPGIGYAHHREVLILAKFATTASVALECVVMKLPMRCVIFLCTAMAAVQNVDRIGAEIFAFFRQYDLERTGETFEEINIGGLGARVKF